MTAAARGLTRRPARTLDRRLLLLLGVPTILSLALFYAPIAAFLALGVQNSRGDVSLEAFSRLTTSDVYVRVLGYSLRFSAAATALTLLLGYPVAYALAHVGPRVRTILLIAMVVPLFTSNLIRSFAWVAILGQEGIVNQVLTAAGFPRASLLYNEFALYVATVHIDLPFMVLTLYGVMQQIDPVYERAAATLGAGPVRRFLRMYLPLTIPGIAAGCLLVFALTIGSFVTPALVAGPGETLIAVLINQQVSTLLNWNLGAALSLLLVGATIVAFVLQARAVRFEP